MKVKYAAILVILSCLLWLLNDLYWIIQSIVEGWFKPVSLVLSILMMSVPIALIALSIALMTDRAKKES
jgi:low temperature requirement protein LtrA